jgi:hypothetical protein
MRSPRRNIDRPADVGVFCYPGLDLNKIEALGSSVAYCQRRFCASESVNSHSDLPRLLLSAIILLLELAAKGVNGP